MNGVTACGASLGVVPGVAADVGACGLHFLSPDHSPRQAHNDGKSTLLPKKAEKYVAHEKRDNAIQRSSGKAPLR